MKLKRILCMFMATTVISATAVCAVFAEGANVGGEFNSAPTDGVECVATEDAIASLGLENPCEVDEDGNVALEDGVLIDLILPKALGGQELASISAKSFAGCPYIRSVVIPETILEIGEDAFANCKFLETIYVIGHSEDDMKLGTNWNGGAEVVYVVDEAEEEAPAQDNAENADKQQEADKAPSNEQPSGTEDAKPADKSESTNENMDTEEKAPAAESGSDEEKGTNAAQQADDGSSSSPSNDACKAAPQDDGDENTGADDAETPTEGAEATEA